MTFVLVTNPASPPGSDEDFLQRVAADAGITRLRPFSTGCPPRTRPVFGLLGTLDGHEVELGGDLMLNNAQAHSAWLSIKRLGERRLRQRSEQLRDRLRSKGYGAEVWEPT